MTGWPIAINTYAYLWSHSARDTIAHLADLGWTRFEVMVIAPHLWPRALSPAERADMARLLAARNLRIITFNPPMLDLNLVAPAPEMRRYTIDHYKDVIELAGEWGVDGIVVVPGKTHPLLPAPRHLVWDWMRAAYDELDRHAERHGTRLLMENVPMGFLPRADDLLAALDHIGNPRLGVCYDAANATFAGESPGAGLRKLADRIGIVHLSDTGLDHWDHRRIGTGIVPFGEVAEAMAALPAGVPTALEIIARDGNGDADNRASHEAVARLGWEPAPAR